MTLPWFNVPVLLCHLPRWHAAGKSTATETSRVILQGISTEATRAFQTPQLRCMGDTRLTHSSGLSSLSALSTLHELE